MRLSKVFYVGSTPLAMDGEVDGEADRKSVNRINPAPKTKVLKLRSVLKFVSLKRRACDFTDFRTLYNFLPKT